jgi:hypothetical protein
LFRDGRNDPVERAWRSPLLASFVDERTGYETTSVLTVPMRTADGRIMGAFQAVNKP